jgi:hypothetical protein
MAATSAISTTTSWSSVARELRTMPTKIDSGRA